MKKLFLYLFIFSALINVFTYMYFTKKMNAEAESLQKKEAKAEKKQTIIDSLELKIFEISHYSLAGNDQAQNFVERYVNIYTDVDKVKNAIMELNHQKGGNSLVGFEDENDPYIISRAQILNHRWILADFDNTTIGGQILVRYYLNDDGSFEFETIDKAFYLPKAKLD